MILLIKSWRAVFVSIGCALFGGCSATGSSITSLADEINATLSEVRTTVMVGDTVNVTFPFRSDWNQTARVMPDGYASFVLVGQVYVAGLSVPDLNKRLRERYEGARTAEKVELTASVTMSDGDATSVGENIFVIGEVGSPGAVEWTGRRLTLTEAISAAGGPLKATANLRDTVLIRRVRGSNKMRSWRLNADINQWGEHPAIFLQARDVVFVPNTTIDNVDIFVDQWMRQMIPLPIIPFRPGG